MFEYAESFSMNYSLNNNNNGKKETEEERSQRIRDTIYKPPPRGESIHDLQVIIEYTKTFNQSNLVSS